MTTRVFSSYNAAEEFGPLREWLRGYYGRRLKRSSDLKQKACCTAETMSRYADVLKRIPEPVLERHYGCGCPIPEDDLDGLTVLDLGSGSGVDAFVLSRLVGQEGFVHGIDMTVEQLEIARRFAPDVARNFGYERVNTAFHEGFIETAEMIPDASVDLAVSDCVMNLSPRKDLVFDTIRRVLKEGGEFYISDIAADRRVPEEIRSDPEMVAECLGGALYEHDWFDLMAERGFKDPRIVSRRLVQTEALGQPIRFYSLTVRAFKFSEPLDNRCEDYGQFAVYDGRCGGAAPRFTLDDHHVFEAGRPAAVCRNTARMLSGTRLAKYFEVTPPVRHFGLFHCGPARTAADGPDPAGCC